MRRRGLARPDGIHDVREMTAGMPDDLRGCAWAMAARERLGQPVQPTNCGLDYARGGGRSGGVAREGGASRVAAMMCTSARGTSGVGSDITFATLPVQVAMLWHAAPAPCPQGARRGAVPRDRVGAVLVDAGAVASPIAMPRSAFMRIESCTRVVHASPAPANGSWMAKDRSAMSQLTERAICFTV
jgi:hypothetical protein